MARKSRNYFDSEIAQEHFLKWRDKGCCASQNALAIMIHEVTKRLVKRSFQNVSKNSDQFDEYCQIIDAHIWTKLIAEKYDPRKGLIFAWVTSVILMRIKDIYRAPKRNTASLTLLDDSPLAPTLRDTTELVVIEEEFHELVLSVQGTFPMFLSRKCVMELLSEVVDHKYRLTPKLMNDINDIIRSNGVRLRGMSRTDFTFYLLSLVRNKATQYAVDEANTQEGITLERVIAHIVGDDNARAVMSVFSGMTLVIPEPIKRKRKYLKTAGR